MIKRTDRVGVIIMLGSAMSAVIGLGFILIALEWFPLGFAMMVEK